MHDVDLNELRDILRRMPVMVEMQPLSLAFLSDDVRVFSDAWEMAAELDSPMPQPIKPMLATHVEPDLRHRLPIVRCTHDPLTTELNRVFLRRYDFIKTYMLCQSQVSDKIVRHADADAVVLMLVDGLSYADVKRHAPEWLTKVEPVLVDGVSITEQGMMRIIGDPPLAQRLFDVGFRHMLGFTYWERDEESLTDRLFTGFGDRVRKVRSFDEALAGLEDEDLQSSFVQIVRSGLDSIAHRQREQPNVAAMVGDILRDFERLIQLFKRRGISAWLHLISDHGILWAHEHTFQVYEFSSADHTRYYEHAKRSKHTLTVKFDGKEFSLLEYPYLRRELWANEKGVHGGLSFEESFVPMISVISETP